jgi:hypothetical protein
LQLRGVDVAPGVEHPRRQMRKNGHLDFNLKQALVFVSGFDINNRQLIADEFLFVVRVENFHRDNRGFWFDNAVDKADQQVLVAFSSTIYLGKEGALKTQSICGLIRCFSFMGKFSCPWKSGLVFVKAGSLADQMGVRKKQIALGAW